MSLPAPGSARQAADALANRRRTRSIVNPVRSVIMRYRGPVSIVVILALLPAWLGRAAPPARAATPWQRPAEDATWLATLNAYRALAAQAPVQDDPAASADCRLHALTGNRNC